MTEEQKERKKAWREANRERRARYNKAYYGANRRQILLGKKVYRQAKRKEIAIRMKAWQESNSARLAAYKKTWEKSNRERLVLRRKAYYQTNRERIRAAQKAWHETNCKDISVRKKNYRQLHRERIAANMKIWRARDSRVSVNNRIRTNCGNMIRHALRRQFGQKAFKTIKLLGCDIPWLRAWIEVQWRPGMTWENQDQWEIDHKRPCASFDLTDPVQQKLCFHWTNLQPLWAAENRAKRDKWEPEMAA